MARAGLLIRSSASIACEMSALYGEGRGLASKLALGHLSTQSEASPELPPPSLLGDPALLGNNAVGVIMFAIITLHLGIQSFGNAP